MSFTGFFLGGGTLKMGLICRRIFLEGKTLKMGLICRHVFRPKSLKIAVFWKSDMKHTRSPLPNLWKIQIFFIYIIKLATFVAISEISMATLCGSSRVESVYATLRSMYSKLRNLKRVRGGARNTHFLAPPPHPNSTYSTIHSGWLRLLTPL